MLAFLLHAPCFMFNELYQHLPQYIDPIVFSIGSFSLRWYSLSYVIGFAVVYLVLMWRIKHQEVDNIYQISNFQFPITKFQNTNKKTNQKSEPEIRNTILDFLLVSFFAASVGGRLGYVLFYNAQYYLTNPMAIISPFDGGCQLTGLYGMSYHGALLGILLGSFFYLRAKKIDFFTWADFVVLAVPLGYFFGRLGNFLNGELYGRITTSPWGMYFGNDLSYLRHPSQLYEAFGEGLLLFIILWSLRNLKWKKGSLLATYLIGYGFFRTVAEQFREPDPQIGLLLGYFSLGQLFSLIMILGGIVLLVSINRKKCYTD